MDGIDETLRYTEVKKMIGPTTEPKEIDYRESRIS
jgi:hypothetical protein